MLVRTSNTCPNFTPPPLPLLRSFPLPPLHPFPPLSVAPLSGTKCVFMFGARPEELSRGQTRHFCVERSIEYSRSCAPLLFFIRSSIYRLPLPHASTESGARCSVNCYQLLRARYLLPVVFPPRDSLCHICSAQLNLFTSFYFTSRALHSLYCAIEPLCELANGAGS